MLLGQKSKLYVERLRQLERLGLLLSFEHQLLGDRPSEVESNKLRSRWSAPLSTCGTDTPCMSCGCRCGRQDPVSGFTISASNHPGQITASRDCRISLIGVRTRRRFES
jgi:hypothetical protein